MIKLSLQDKSNTLSSLQIETAVTENAPILSAAKNAIPSYSDSLGWVEPTEHANTEKIALLLEKAKEVRENADVFILVGVGGSNQGARAAIKALANDSSPEIIYAGNTLSAVCVSKLLEKIQGKSVYMNVIAKNFETLEPGVWFRVLREYLHTIYEPHEVAKRIIVTGTPGSHLEQISNEHHVTFFDFPQNMGGRYSVVSNVGLFAMAVAGLNISAVVVGATAMKQHLFTTHASENQALYYACLRNLLIKKGFQLELFSFFEPQFRYFAKWWVQLFGESEGKNGKGLFPASAEYSEDLHAIGQFVQDGSPVLFETFLCCEDAGRNYAFPESALDDGFDYLTGKSFAHINQVAESATIEAHGKRFPCLKITVPNINEYDLGQLFYFFEFSCYLSGFMLGVNPFDQPGVEAYKQEMFAKLGKP